MANSHFEHQRRSIPPRQRAFHALQKFDSIDHLFGCDNVRKESQSPDALTQSQSMHIYENYAAVVVSRSVDLCGDLDQIGIMCENHGLERSGMSQLTLVSYSDLLLVICRTRLYSPAAQTFGDSHVHVLIGVDF